MINLHRKERIMYLFTYGTFKTGECRNHILKGRWQLFSERDSPLFKTKNLYSLYDIGKRFPAIINNPDIKVEGEVYEVDEELVVKTLDRIEGCPHLYERHLIEVCGVDELCITYIMKKETFKNLELNGTNMRKLTTGNWKG